MGRKKDLTGQRFGKWLVLEEDGKIGSNIAWKCKCDCGNVKRIRATVLTNGYSKSCGCNRIEAITIHNGTNTRLFNVWRNIKERCTNTNYKTFYLYGGRGIKVCEEWFHSYEAFKQWAIRNGYQEGLTIDRIDVNGNYEPTNCRWVSNIEQARNKRNTIFLEYNGERKSISEWAEFLGKTHNTLYWRYSQNWSTKEILYGRQAKL